MKNYGLLVLAASFFLLGTACSKKEKSKSAPKTATTKKAGDKNKTATKKTPANPKKKATKSGSSSWYNVNIPADLSEISGIMRIDVSKVVNSQFLNAFPQIKQALQEKASDPDIKAFIKCTGFTGDNFMSMVDHVLVVFSNNEIGGGVAELKGVKFSKIMECAKNMKSADKPEYKEITVAGKKAYLFTDKDSDKEKTVSVPIDDTHVVFAVAKDEKIATDFATKLVSKLPLCKTFISGDKPTGYAIWGYTNKFQAMPKDKLPPQLRNVKLGALQGYLNLSKDLELKVMMDLGTEDDAKKAADMFQKELQTKLFPQLKAMNLSSLEKSITVKPKGKILCLKLKLTVKDINTIMPMIGMMMMQARPMRQAPAMPAPSAKVPASKTNMPKPKTIPMMKMNLKLEGAKGVKNLKIGIMKK